MIGPVSAGELAISPHGTMSARDSQRPAVVGWFGAAAAFLKPDEVLLQHSIRGGSEG